MTKQELADLSDARMIINNTAPDSGAHETLTRVLDSWEEKDRRLACVCAVSADLLKAATAAVDRYVCAGNRCGTPRCPHGYECQAYTLKKEVLRLWECMGGGNAVS